MKNIRLYQKYVYKVSADIFYNVVKRTLLLYVVKDANHQVVIHIMPSRHENCRQSVLLMLEVACV